MILVKRYRLPITGTVLEREPLRGLESDPISVIALSELPSFPTYYDEAEQAQIPENFRYICLNYNIDEGWGEIELEASEELHKWLIQLLPQLGQMPKRLKIFGERERS